VLIQRERKERKNTNEYYDTVMSIGMVYIDVDIAYKLEDLQHMVLTL